MSKWLYGIIAIVLIGLLVWFFKPGANHANQSASAQQGANNANSTLVSGRPNNTLEQPTPLTTGQAHSNSGASSGGGEPLFNPKSDPSIQPIDPAVDPANEIVNP